VTRQIHQRYQREFWPPMLVYLLIMLLLWPLLPQLHSAWLKIGLALLPVLPVLFVVRAMVRLVLGSDELEQRIHLIGLAIAATVVSALSLAGGFLAMAGIIHPDGSILIWVWPVLVVLYAVSRGWASQRYGVQGDGLCDSGSRIARHWRLLLAALLLGGIAWLGHSRMSDYQFGVMLGMSAGLGLGGLWLALRHWYRTRHAA